MHKLKLVAWEAWYEDVKYTSEEHDWKALPREGMKILKKFYHIFDEKGEKHLVDGVDTFFELVYGHPMIALTQDNLKEYKKLPREIKFMDSLGPEELELYKAKAEEKND